MITGRYRRFSVLFLDTCGGRVYLCFCPIFQVRARSLFEGWITFCLN